MTLPQSVAYSLQTCSCSSAAGRAGGVNKTGHRTCGGMFEQRLSQQSKMPCYSSDESSLSSSRTLSTTSRSNPSRTHSSFLSSSSAWLPFFALMILLAMSDLCLPMVEAGCRTSSGLAMCCRGRQSTCSSFTSDDSWNTTGRESYVKTVTRKRCFCDEHCARTKDCCPDYQDVCRRPVLDCRVSEWGPWAECDRQCGPGESVRRRRILQAPTNGGLQCPALQESRPCQGTRCYSRRVGRSGSVLIPYMYQTGGEVAQLLPVRGDVMQMLRQHDMRWDVRRKLYLGRLIQQNRTEQPEPEPYCSIYEITHANPACQSHNLLWKNNAGSYWDSNRYMPYSSNPYLNYRIRRHRSWGSVDNPPLQSKRLLNDWGMTNTWSHVWMTHAALLTPGQQICVTCYPAYIRCPAVGYLGMETRWRALRTADCQGTFRLVTTPQRPCTCGQGVASFVFV